MDTKSAAVPAGFTRQRFTLGVEEYPVKNSKGEETGRKGHSIALRKQDGSPDGEWILALGEAKAMELYSALEQFGPDKFHEALRLGILELATKRLPKGTPSRQVKSLL